MANRQVALKVTDLLQLTGTCWHLSVFINSIVIICKPLQISVRVSTVSLTWCFAFWPNSWSPQLLPISRQM